MKSIIKNKTIKNSLFIKSCCFIYDEKCYIADKGCLSETIISINSNIFDDFNFTKIKKTIHLEDSIIITRQKDKLFYPIRQLL